MKKIGIDDIDTFKFIDEPDYRIITNAIKDLQRFGALDKEEKITEKGHTMADLPIEPRLSNLILEAEKNKCVESICTIASFLELKPVIIHLTYEEIFKKLVEEYVVQNKVPSSKLQVPNEDVLEEDFEENSDTETEVEEALLDPSMYLSSEEWDQLQGEASREYKNYLATIKQFEHSLSDFFTMLEIYKKWEKAEMRTEWAQHHYLSADTLDEATNIREELLDIVQKRGYSTADKLGKDLYERIEKTLISAFKYNTLVKQNNGFYKRARANDTGIRLHNSSVLMSTKPDYVISYEVIEISEIDAEPKLSAKFIHALSEKHLQQFFPDVLKRRKKRDRFEKRNRRFKFRGDRGGRRR
jgi:ATP-dependent helicase HrpA